jgi:predicted DCC family thiol-disulfide oxidoreductase YuxK
VILFYDGHCAMCNRAVLFVLRRDPAARFSPLDGTLAKSKLPQGLPDTMVVQTGAGVLLLRSDAWIYILRRLPAPWRTLGHMLASIPRPIRDGCYRLVARCRRVFRSSPDACPIIPVELRNRFNS